MLCPPFGAHARPRLDCLHLAACMYLVGTLPCLVDLVVQQRSLKCLGFVWMRL